MQTNIVPTLLSIAGSDPSGGAGIQADLKTMTSIGVYGAAVITCLTVQNSQGVQSITPLPATFVQQQITAVLSDHNVTHIKIGMTGTLEIVEMLGELLKNFPGKIIFDPVFAASTGEPLFQKDGLQFLKKNLLDKVTYLTPNSMELAKLTDNTIDRPSEAIDSARQLLASLPKMQGVVVKGGHLEMKSNTISDFLVQQNNISTESKRERLNNKNLHGTGCTYASALASCLCLGSDPILAFQQAGKYMDTIIKAGMNRSAVREGNNGPLLHHTSSCSCSNPI